jgi:hypothetical protein
MDLNELIEKEGLESVSEKTNISIFNLNRLSNEDFGELNRVKALGFLHILKREYDIDTSKLEQSIKTYFEEHPQVSDEPLIATKRDDKKKNKKIAIKGFEKWIFGAILLGALWYLYSSGKLKDIVGGEKSDINISLLNSDTNKSEKIDAEKLEESIIIKKEDNKTKIEINTSNEPKLDKNSSDKLKIVADIPDGNKSAKDANKTILVDKDAGVEEPTESTPTPDKNSTEIKNITINPTRGLLWYGLIDLDRRKKKDYTTRKSKTFDLKGHRWLLLSGHGFFDIVSENKTVSLGDRKKHYFYIDGKEIKEITRREFKRLNHGRLW